MRVQRGVSSAGRVVVTGGAAFLGSHLCTELLDRGAEVVCLAASSPGLLRTSRT